MKSGVDISLLLRFICLFVAFYYVICSRKIVEKLNLIDNMESALHIVV